VSYWEVSDNLNPIFFIVFKDQYASWAMFPKPSVVRKRKSHGILVLGFWKKVSLELAYSASDRMIESSQHFSLLSDTS